MSAGTQPPEVETQPLHLVNSPTDAPYCGWENARPRREGVMAGGGSPVRTEVTRLSGHGGYSGAIETALFIEDVTCTACVHESIRRAMTRLAELRADGVPDVHPDVQDLETQAREGVERLGELSLMKYHPQQYERMMREKNKPPAPEFMAAVVRTHDGHYFTRVRVGGGPAWREIGSVRLAVEGIGGEDEPDQDYRDLDVVQILFGGVRT